PAEAPSDGAPGDGGRPDRAAGLRERLAGLTEPERDELLLEVVEECVAGVLGEAPHTGFDPERGFLEQGFDSLTAVELRKLLTDATGLRLSSTLIFDYPTPAALAKELRTSLDPELPGAGPSTSEDTEATGTEAAGTAEAVDDEQIDDMDLAELLRLARDNS
ncbi:acyl carrier protein, partial [Kitasatospora sp. NPDC005856]|uniref:acyl carrier protein n=1 Tax=Kitasatospora sp. NPDC005856 TaxID=3154566 RepID=UPI0033DDAC24